MMSVRDDFPDDVIGGVGSEGVKRLVMIDSGACDTAFKKQDFPGAALDKSQKKNLCACQGSSLDVDGRMYPHVKFDS